MTTRLLGQWVRLLSQCPRASASAATRLQAHTAQLVEPLWSKTQIQMPVRPLCVGREKTLKKVQRLTFKRTRLDIRLENASTPEAVLKAWQDLGGSPNHAALCLIQINRLAKRTKENTSTVLNDPRFVDLLKSVNSRVAKIWNGSLVALLHALSNLGVSPSSAVYRSLQTEALWRLRRLTYRQLLYLVEPGHIEHQKEKEILTKAVLKQLDLRWTELTDSKTVSDLMSRASQLPLTLRDKLQDKALELAEQFSAEDIRKTALALALQGRRAVPLLQSLSYHLHQKPSSELKTPLLLDIAFAFGKLHFFQYQVFDRMAVELLPRLQELTPTDVTRCAKSLAILRWLHQPLFEGFAQHLNTNSENYKTYHICNLLLSFAKLNFQPSNKEVFKKVHEFLEGSWQGLEPVQLTDVVWSLCVLQQAKPDLITAVLDPAFQTKLTGKTYTLKLLNIAASCQLESLGNFTILPSVPEDKAPALTSLQSDLHCTLQSLASGCPTALRIDVHTVYGWIIAAELVVDSENNPIDLQSFVAPHLPEGGGSEQLPQGAHRIAFLTWEFTHFGSRSKELLGCFAMQKRHLQLAGFLVVEVPYFDWLELGSDWKKVAYLNDKIRKVVAEYMAK